VRHLLRRFKRREIQCQAGVDYLFVKAVGLLMEESTGGWKHEAGSFLPVSCSGRVTAKTGGISLIGRKRIRDGEKKLVPGVEDKYKEYLEIVGEEDTYVYSKGGGKGLTGKRVVFLRDLGL